LPWLLITVTPGEEIFQPQVVLDDSGFSKGFGFIRFGNEQEQQTAMTSMMGVSGLGGKPIKVSIAVQKTKLEDNSMDIPQHLVQHVANQMTGGASSNHQGQQPGGEYGGGDYGGGAHKPAEGGNYGSEYYNQYNQYWSQYAAWQQYQQQYAAWEQQQAQSNTQPAAAAAPPGPPGQPPADKPKKSDPHSLLEGPLTQLVEHKKVLDVKELNKDWLEKSEELWSSVEESGWWYVGKK